MKKAIVEISLDTIDLAKKYTKFNLNSNLDNIYCDSRKFLDNLSFLIRGSV